MKRFKKGEVKKHVLAAIEFIAKHEAKSGSVGTCKISVGSIDSLLRDGETDLLLPGYEYKAQTIKDAGLILPGWSEIPYTSWNDKAGQKIKRALEQLVQEGILESSGARRKSYSYIYPEERARREARIVQRKRDLQEARQLISECGLDPDDCVVTAQRITLTLDDLKKILDRR